MSFLFKPPIAVASEVEMAQVFGFRQTDEGFFSRVRAAQQGVVARFIPFIVSLLLVNVGVLLASFWGHPSWPVLLGWAGVWCAAALIWWVRSHRRNAGPPAAGLGARAFWWININAVAMALLWVPLLWWMMPAATPMQQMLLVVLSVMAMAAVGFGLAVMPVAGCGVPLLLALGIAAAMPHGSAMDHPAILVAVLSLALVICRGVIVTSFALMSRMRSETELRQSTEVVKLLLNEFESNGTDWLLELDRQGRLSRVSPRFCMLVDHAEEALLGQPFAMFLEGLESGLRQETQSRMMAVFTARRPFRDLLMPVALGGEARYWSLSGTPKMDEHGRFSGYRGLGRDVTEVHDAHQKVATLARYDTLTGLANRALFAETVRAGLHHAQRHATQLGLMIIDLDYFKRINDIYGHLLGDQVLVVVADRLRAVAAGPAAVPVRLGGDEFAILLSEATPGRMQALAEAVVAALSELISIEHHNLRIGASIGWAMGPADGATQERLVKCADLALYETKNGARGGICRFDLAIRQRAEERHQLERELSRALEGGQLFLAFQPIVSASDEHIVGFEALLRWQHPQLGRVGPDRFIPLAEESGLIIPIGRWVIEQACHWLAQWPDDVHVAVNLSPAQIDDPELVDTVKRALRAHDLPAERLELEITERLFLDERASTLERLRELADLGVKFALDDFGTGYSALGYLQKFAFNRIKIDRSFVSKASFGSEASAIIAAIVELAVSLGMSTTAEGTETRAEFEMCRDLGCAQVQGYLFGKPMPPEQATALVAPMVAGVLRMADQIGPRLALSSLPRP